MVMKMVADIGTMHVGQSEIIADLIPSAHATRLAIDSL